MSDELATLDAVAQAKLVERGEVRPVELVEAAIARLEKLNPRLNAVVATAYDALPNRKPSSRIHSTW